MVVISAIYAVYAVNAKIRIENAKIDAEIEAATRLAEDLDVYRVLYDPSVATTIKHRTFAAGTTIASINAALGSSFPSNNRYGNPYTAEVSDFFVAVTTTLPGNITYSNSPTTYDAGLNQTSVVVFPERKRRGGGRYEQAHFEKSFLYGRETVH